LKRSLQKDTLEEGEDSSAELDEARAIVPLSDSSCSSDSRVARSKAGEDSPK
jgi:hypothetical protein